jgi:hypothetical protein
VGGGYRVLDRIAGLALTSTDPPNTVYRHVILANVRRETGRYRLSDLLPLPFDGRLL